MNLGRATNEAVNTLKAGVANEHADWTPVGSSALWVQPSATEYSFELDPTSSPKKTDLYVAYVQVNPDGSPIDGAEVAVEEVENAEKVPIALKDLTAGAPYAVMLFNNKEYTLAPMTSPSTPAAVRARRTMTTAVSPSSPSMAVLT